ncbi:MAG: HIRAN domain-containing protein [Marinilabiliales bacterium]|nr:HIRAN domain-containing protein [Marinilabiliales bacterium]
MNESILPVTPGLLALLSKTPVSLTPFTQEIFLLEIVVAGTTHCPGIREIEPEILPEKVLVLKREPGNPHDPWAIAIHCDEVRIGYVPSEMNQVCSRLMDAGKLFFCRVVSKKWKGQWLKIDANIYMVD